MRLSECVWLPKLMYMNTCVNASVSMSMCICPCDQVCDHTHVCGHVCTHVSMSLHAHMNTRVSLYYQVCEHMYDHMCACGACVHAPVTLSEHVCECVSVRVPTGMRTPEEENVWSPQETGNCRWSPQERKQGSWAGA